MNGEPRIVIFPTGTYVFPPDDKHQVTIEFPDEDSAIIFFEWCRQVVIDAGQDGDSQ